MSKTNMANPEANPGIASEPVQQVQNKGILHNIRRRLLPLGLTVALAGSVAVPSTPNKQDQFSPAAQDTQTDANVPIPAELIPLARPGDDKTELIPLVEPNITNPNKKTFTNDVGRAELIPLARPGDDKTELIPLVEPLAVDPVKQT